MCDIVNTKWHSFVSHMTLFVAPPGVRVAAYEVFEMINPSMNHPVYPNVQTVKVT